MGLALNMQVAKNQHNNKRTHIYGGFSIVGPAGAVDVCVRNPTMDPLMDPPLNY